VDRTGDPLLTNNVFDAIHIILSLKLGDHEGLIFFVHGRFLKRTLLLVLPAILVQIPICAFLNPVPSTAESSPRLPAVAWQPLAGFQILWPAAPGNSASVLCILFYFSY